MARELREVTATHVSIVKKAANGKKFLLTKSDDNKEAFELNVDRIIVNKDSEEQIVTGIVYSPDEVDLQGDFMTADTIEKMAYDFLENYRNIDKNHEYIAGEGSVVESYIAPADIEIGGIEVKKGSWVLSTRVTDEVWQLVKSGEFTGFSIGGYCKSAVEVDKGIKEKLYEVAKGLFGKQTVEKDFNEELTNRLNNNFWDVFRVFEDAVNHDYWNTDDSKEMKGKILKSIMQMYEHVSGMSFERINKEAQVPEDLQKEITALNKSVEDSVAVLNGKITELAKQMEVFAKMFEHQAKLNEAIEKSLIERQTAVGIPQTNVKKEKEVPLAMGMVAK